MSWSYAISVVGLALLTTSVAEAQPKILQMGPVEIEIAEGWGRRWMTSVDGPLVDLFTPYEVDATIQKLLKLSKIRGLATVSESWDTSLDAWRTRHAEGIPTQVSALLGANAVTVRTAIEDREGYTMFSWEGHGEPNWLIDFNDEVKDLTLRYLEAAIPGKDGKVKLFVVLAAVSSDSRELKADMDRMVASIVISDVIVIRFVE